jgi:hypothetical protein
LDLVLPDGQLSGDPPGDGRDRGDGDGHEKAG